MRDPAPYVSGNPRLTACPECDLVQREPAFTGRATVSCRRCGAVLYRAVPAAIDRSLALTLAAAILFFIANFYPIMTLALQERHVSATLFDLALAFHDEGMPAVGAIVFLTLILLPGLEILARLHLLLPLRLGRVPREMALVSRLLASIRSWSMVEVFVLAGVVCIHRLNQIGQLELEPAFWAMGALMLVFAATDSIFDARALWARVPARTA